MSKPGLHYFQDSWQEASEQVLDVDICVYGGTSAGVSAAVTAARRNRSVVILNPAQHVGGMTTGGLGWTDAGKEHVIGGLSRQFYRDLGNYYGTPAEVWNFEPHAAAKVYAQWLQDTQIPVYNGQFLDETHSDGSKITEVRMLSGLVVRAKVFIDATYEGDLMAQAGVTYTVGREANGQYGETYNGIQVLDKHQFSHFVDPYLQEGDAASGLLPHVNSQDVTDMQGTGDHRIQAYCFRICMTNDPQLRQDWIKPAGFDPTEYILASRWFNSEKDAYNELLRADGELAKFDKLIKPHKTDTNNHGPVNSDYIGANYHWPEASYKQREQIFQQHVTYQQGLYWFLANDPSIPIRYREQLSQWGLARDEYEDTNHWPHQLYVREARRMVSDYVITEHDCMHRRICEDPIGMGSYNIDSHNCQRFVHNGRVLNDGDVQIPPAGPYGISYRTIVPKTGQTENLFVPVCISASHVSYGSVRMEPVFMILGESAAIAADLVLSEGITAQQLPYDMLLPELKKAGQVLTNPA